MVMMRARAAVVVAVLAVACLLGVGDAVDQGKFRTCAQTGFCRRLRDAETLGPWNVDVQSVAADVDNAALSAVLVDPKGTRVQMKVQVYVNNVVRVTVDELDGEALYVRHRVRDVLQPSGLQTIRAQRIVSGSTRTAMFIDDDLTVFVRFAPFRVQVQRGGKIRLTVNAKDLMQFETYRKPNPKPENEADVDPNAVYDQEGTWSESFGGQTDSRPRGPAAVSLDFQFESALHVYGIPEHATNLSLPDTRGDFHHYSEPYRLFNLDVFEYELDVPMALYGAIPFMMALGQEGTAAVLWLNAAETFIDVSSDPSGKQARWISESGVIDAFLFSSPTPSSVFFAYASLTGLPALPPRFALGYHQCRWNYRDEPDVFAVDQGFDDHDIPYDVLWLDIEHTDQKKYFTWDPVKFPNPAGMVDRLWGHKRRMVTIVDPHIKRDPDYFVHQRAEQDGLYVKKADGQSVYEGWCWPGSVSYLDFTVQKVRDFWASLFRFDTYIGSTFQLFSWIDMNEPSVFNGPEITMPKDCLHEGGVEHRDVHNQYGFYDQMATFQGQLARQSAATSPDVSRRPFILSRSFFAGSQRFGAVWTGDNLADWGHLKASLPMIMSMGVAGLPFVGADVGGFFKDPDPELLVRWYQAGAYQPFFRGHAHIDTARREPWLFGEDNTWIIQQAIRDRYSLMPYLYTVFRNASVSGLPIMRPLWVEFPSDVKVFAIEDHHLLGSDLLVRPITSAGETSVMVTFPGSEQQIWYDTVTHQGFVGDQTLSVAVVFERIPVYQRGGSIIARHGRARRSSHCQLNDPFTLVVALDAKESAYGTLYLDDGHTFEHQTGAFTLRSFVFEDLTLRGSPAARTQFKFMADNRLERIIVVGLRRRLSSVTMGAGNSQVAFDFVQTFNPDQVIVRKPWIGITDDFEIRFNAA
ncbi:Glucosidase II subunit alpha [Plasmodiophora brassicae]